VGEWIALKRPYFVVALLLICGDACSAVELKQETTEAFDHYVAALEQRLKPRFSGDHFLWFDDSPELRQKLLNSAVLVQPGQGTGVATVKDGLIQDWIGGVFVPGVNLKGVLSVVQDYDHHGEMYKPQITDAKMQSHIGDTFLVFMRVVKAKFFLTDVLNTDHEIRYVPLDSKRVYSLSYSKRIAEVTDAGKPGEHELPVGRDRGFLWRLYSYWFFEERDGGVYITCQSVTLTRDIPAIMARVLGPILRELPGESLRIGLEQTRRAVLAAK
jgi:hypothetical protein